MRVLAVASLLIAGCYASHRRIDPRIDAGSDAELLGDAADAGAACEAVDLHGVGACGSTLGYAWTGASCEPVVGCRCEGASCSLLGSADACATEHAGCAWEVCEPGCETCLPPDGACDAPSACLPPGCGDGPVCGCDGYSYPDRCAAHAAHTGVAYTGECAWSPSHLVVGVECYEDTRDVVWGIHIGNEPMACDFGTPPPVSLDIWVFTRRDLPTRSWRVGTDPSIGGYACNIRRCGVGISGRFEVEHMDPGSAIRVSYDLIDGDGVRFVGTAGADAVWCGLPVPRCGS